MKTALYNSRPWRRRNIFYSQKWAICHLHISDHYIIHLVSPPSTLLIRYSFKPNMRVIIGNCHFLLSILMESVIKVEARFLRTEKFTQTCHFQKVRLASRANAKRFPSIKIVIAPGWPLLMGAHHYQFHRNTNFIWAKKLSRPQKKQEKSNSPFRVVARRHTVGIWKRREYFLF